MKVDALRTCDKQELTSHLRKLYTLKFPWADDTLVQRTGVVKITSIGERAPHHLKSPEGRGPHHLKWPFFLFLFMGLVGYLHAINPCIWPHLRPCFWHLMSFKRREETREVYSQRQLGSRLGCVQRRLGINNTPPPSCGSYQPQSFPSQHKTRCDEVLFTLHAWHVSSFRPCCCFCQPEV